MSGSEPKQALESFIKCEPNSDYTFDSERGSSISELCRQSGKNDNECITLQMNAKRLFQAMQDQGFFCSLPIDPERTYMKCRPLPR